MEERDERKEEEMERGKEWKERNGCMEGERKRGGRKGAREGGRKGQAITGMWEGSFGVKDLKGKLKQEEEIQQTKSIVYLSVFLPYGIHQTSFSLFCCHVLSSFFIYVA